MSKNLIRNIGQEKWDTMGIHARYTALKKALEDSGYLGHCDGSKVKHDGTIILCSPAMFDDLDVYANREYWRKRIEEDHLTLFEHPITGDIEIPDWVNLMDYDEAVDIVDTCIHLLEFPIIDQDIYQKMYDEAFEESFSEMFIDRNKGYALKDDFRGYDLRKLRNAAYSTGYITEDWFCINKVAALEAAKEAV